MEKKPRPQVRPRMQVRPRTLQKALLFLVFCKGDIPDLILHMVLMMKMNIPPLKSKTTMR